MDRIPVAQPNLTGNERRYVLDCLDTGWISSIGKYIGLFEKEFARFCNVEHAIATNNGTTALHLALVALGLQPGDEVLVPTLTYVASANVVRYCHATPVLVDVCPDTLAIDPAELEKKITARTKGILPVHLYGHPAEMGPINEIAKQHRLFVLEDAAEAHGAEYLGRRVGGLATCAAFSFFGNKIVTTGEGGMVTTNDPDLAARLRLHRGQGMNPNRRYWFEVVGYNYRMTNIQAALGLAQLENVDSALAGRQRIAQWYNEALAPLRKQLVLPVQKPWARHVYWMYTVFLREGDEQRRDAVMRSLDAAGIESRPVFYPMHLMPPYRENGSYPVADTWAGRGINLPTHPHLTPALIQRVADSLATALANS